MSSFYAKRGRVTWLARNTTEFAKYHGPRFFPGHVFITTLKDYSRGKRYSARNAHPTNWHQVPSDTSRRGLIPACRVCRPRSAAMSEITHNLTFDTAGCSSPPRSELESQLYSYSYVTILSRVINHLCT